MNSLDSIPFMPSTPERPVRIGGTERKHSYDLRSLHPFPLFDQELALRHSRSFYQDNKGRVRGFRFNYPASPCIYGIFDKETHRWYVGRTERPLQERLNEHHSAANKNESNVGQLNMRGARSDFYKNLKERPRDFVSTILCQAPDLDVVEAEKYYIASVKGYSEGYNANQGGDGSRPMRPQVSALVAGMDSEKLSRFIGNVHHARSKKTYPLIYKGGRATLLATPSARRKKPVVYEMETDDGRVYCGSSIDSLSSRFYGHASSCSSAINQVFENSNIKNAKVHVLYQSSDPARVRLFESARIECYKKMGKRSLNRTGGILSSVRSVEKSPAQSGRRFRRLHNSVKL